MGGKSKQEEDMSSEGERMRVVDEREGGRGGEERGTDDDHDLYLGYGLYLAHIHDLDPEKGSPSESHESP